MTIEYRRSVVPVNCRRCLDIGASPTIEIGHQFVALTGANGVTHYACMDCFERLRAEIEKITLEPEHTALILGALNTLACALADLGHTWTDGERA